MSDGLTPARLSAAVAAYNEARSKPADMISALVAAGIFSPGFDDEQHPALIAARVAYGRAVTRPTSTPVRQRDAIVAAIVAAQEKLHELTPNAADVYRDFGYVVINALQLHSQRMSMAAQEAREASAPGLAHAYARSAARADAAEIVFERLFAAAGVDAHTCQTASDEDVDRLLTSHLSERTA